MKKCPELEKKLWGSADALRGNVSSERYTYVVVGLFFLKYISDKYKSAIKKIEKRYPKNPEKWSVYCENSDILSVEGGSHFIVPEKARWEYISEFASSANIGEKIDDALDRIEKKNKKLLGLFEKNYNSQELDQAKLGQVVTIFSDIDLNECGEDFIGRAYEYFLGRFFKKQGQKGGEFYTPFSIVDLLVSIIQPDRGRLYDPACGTGGMFIQSKQWMRKNNRDYKSLNVYGQESQDKIWRLAQINLMVHGFDFDNISLGAKSSDTFSQDQHKGELFDYILANPPFNMKSWGQQKLLDDPRWKWGIPPKGNANYGWLSHIISKLDKNGCAGVVLAYGSLSSQKKEELEIRKNLIEENKIDAIITMPDKLFYTTGIPACLWILNNNKKNKKILMINASELSGTMISKKLRELTSKEINKISNLYQQHKNNEMINEADFAKSIDKSEIKENDYSFMPGRYVDIDFSKNELDKKQITSELKKLTKEIPELLKTFNENVSKIDDSFKKLWEKLEEEEEEEEEEE